MLHEWQLLSRGRGQESGPWNQRQDSNPRHPLTSWVILDDLFEKS